MLIRICTSPVIVDGSLSQVSVGRANCYSCPFFLGTGVVHIGQGRTTIECRVADARNRQIIICTRNHNISVGASTNACYGITFAVIIQSVFKTTP